MVEHPLVSPLIKRMVSEDGSCASEDGVFRQCTAEIEKSESVKWKNVREEER